MSASRRNFIRIRAEQRCEYCRLSESDLPYYPFHAEHIIARKHRGTDDAQNRCWACQHCNLAKSRSNCHGPVAADLKMIWPFAASLYEDHTVPELPEVETVVREIRPHV